MVDNTTPLLHYFACGNIFSGSNKKKRYKIWPDKETGQMLCKAWIGELCIELTPPEEIAEASFPITEEGRADMIRWLNDFNGVNK